MLMILTVEELRKFVTTDETDEVLSMQLAALEQMIHGYTHNNFRRFKNAEGVIEYPADIKMGVVNLMKWEADNRDKVGIQSESLSRHSVTYADMTASNTINGYPVALMGFLKPYMKARFGQGVRV
jgi:hypothetical protein